MSSVSVGATFGNPSGNTLLLKIHHCLFIRFSFIQKDATAIEMIEMVDEMNGAIFRLVKTGNGSALNITMFSKEIGKSSHQFGI